MKLDDNAFIAAAQQYGFAGGVLQPGGFKWTRDFLKAYCTALPADDALIEKLETHKYTADQHIDAEMAASNSAIDECIEIVRQHQSVQTPPVCNVHEPLIGWQPIETAPKDGEPILGWVEGMMYVCWWKSVGWRFFQ